MPREAVARRFRTMEPLVSFRWSAFCRALSTFYACLAVDGTFLTEVNGKFSGRGTSLVQGYSCFSGDEVCRYAGVVSESKDETQESALNACDTIIFD